MITREVFSNFVLYNYFKIEQSTHHFPEIMYPISNRADAPIALKPSPPASTYILQYSKYKKTLMKQDIERTKQSSLLTEIDRLSTVIREQESKFINEKEQILKNVVLLSLQVEHMRQIHSQYEYKLKISEETCADMQEMYQLRLQQIKTELSQSFYVELAAEKEKTMKDFLQLKQIYSSKIALIGQSTKNKQIQLDLKTQEAHDRALKIQLYQCKVIEKQKAIAKYSDRIVQLEQENDQKRQQIKYLQEKMAKQEQQTNQIINNLKIRAGQVSQLNQELHEQLQTMRASSMQREEQYKKLEQDNIQLKAELELSLKKMNKLQKELDELNRKTFKNKQIPLSGHHQPRQLTEREREHFMTENHISGNIKQSKQLRQAKQSSQKIEQLQQLIHEKEQIINEKEQIINQKEQSINQKQQLINEKEQNIIVIKQQLQKQERIIKQQQEQLQKLTHKCQQIIQLQGQAIIKENQQNQLTQKYTQLQSTLSEINDKLVKKERQLREKENALQELREEVTDMSEEYGQKMLILTKRTSNLQISWRDKEKQMQVMHKKIESQYLRDISALKNQVQNLEKTLVQTNLMFQTMEIKRSEEKGSKSKKKDK